MILGNMKFAPLSGIAEIQESEIKYISINFQNNFTLDDPEFGRRHGRET